MLSHSSGIYCFIWFFNWCHFDLARQFHVKKSLSCIHGNIDWFFWSPHMHRLTSCVICKSLLDDIRGRMNGEWFCKGQSERKDKAKPCNLLINSLSLISLFPFSLALPVCLSPPVLCYIYFKCFLGLCQGFISWPHAKSTAVPRREAEDLTSRNSI